MDTLPIYKNFIKISQDNCMSKLKIANQILAPANDTGRLYQTSQTTIQLDDYEERVTKLSGDMSKLTSGQRSAYDKAVNHISGSDPTQPIMFFSGEGGTGKSFIIALILEYTRSRFGKQNCLYGAAVAMAPTGCSANVISGFTWQSCYGKGRQNDRTSTMSNNSAKKVGERLQGTKLIVLDDIGMINLESNAEISHRHQQGMLAMCDDIEERLMIEKTPFGGTHMLFTGELWQLKPIGGHPIYSTANNSPIQAKKGQKIWNSVAVPVTYRTV